MATFLPDAAVVAVAYATALVFLFAAYRHAGPVWVLRHAVITQGIDKRNVWAGEWGEMIIVSFAAVAALMVIFFTNDVTLIETVPSTCIPSIPLFGKRVSTSLDTNG